MDNLALLVIVGIFALFGLAAFIFLLLYHSKYRKKQDEKIEQLLHEKDLQNQKETERKTSKTKTDFLIKVSQEIRFPLNAIMGFNDLILGKKDLDREVFENASKIHDSGMALLGVIDDILDFSKIEYGKLELIPVDYKISDLINSVISSNMINLESKPIKFNLNIDANLPNSLTGDEYRVKQVFNNILSNAFKYTKVGMVEWSIDFERENDDILLISKIKDSGIGIKKENMEKLFSRYNQVGEQTDGIGLGLAITKEIIEMMGGSIEVESECGKGTTFSVKIKQQLRDAAPIDEKVMNNLKKLTNQSNKEERNLKPVYNQMPYARVLIVDDMALNLEVARGLMKPYGILIDTAPSGKIAIAKIMNQSAKYSAIFMDHMMPEMDGVETVRKIRELDSEYAKKIPIIALTANVIAGSEKMFLENGFNDFLSKPMDIMKLDAVLKKWVRDESKENEP
jgi:signal transduction histidine kinase/ActR/RegA family two-component response regulator